MDNNLNLDSMEEHQQNKQIIGEEDLIKLFHDQNKHNKKKGKKKQENKNLNFNSVKDVDQLDILIQNIKQLNDKIQPYYLSKIFPNLKELILHISTLQQLEHLDIIKFFKYIQDQQYDLEVLSIFSSINKSTFKQIENKNRNQLLQSNYSHAIELIQQLPKIVQSMRLKQFNAIFDNYYNKLTFLYKAQKCKEDKPIFLFEYFNKQYIPLNSINKLLPQFKYLVHLNLRIEYNFFQGQKFDFQGFSTLQSLKYLQLFTKERIHLQNIKRGFTKIKDISITGGDYFILQHYQSFLGSCLLELQSLETLKLNLGVIFAHILFYELNQIENIHFQKSNIKKLTLCIEQQQTKYFPNNFNLEFINKFQNLNKFKYSSQYMHTNNLELGLSNQLNLVYLDLNIKLTENNIDLIGQSFQKFHRIKILKIALYDSSVVKKTQGLLKNLQFLIELKQLHISISKFYQLNPEGFSLLGQTLNKLVDLQKLFLNFSDQKMNDEDLIQFSEGIKELKNLLTLSIILKKQNVFGDKGLFKLAESLVNLSKVSYIQLVLESSNITKKGTQKLQQCLSQLKQKPKIDLDITDIESLISQYFGKNDSGLQKLIKKNTFQYLCLQKQRMPYITTQNQYNSYLKEISSKSEINQLQHQDPYNSIQGINISFEQKCIGQVGMQGLYNGLIQLKNLTQLALKFGYNQISSKGGQILGQLFSHLPLLNDLDLNLEESNLEKEGTDSIYKGLKSLNLLECLSLILNNYYFITKETNFFIHMTYLQKLRLKNQKGIDQLFDPLSQNKSLQFLYLQGFKYFTLEQFQIYFEQIIKLQGFKNFNLFIHINLKRGSEQQITDMFTQAMSHLQGLNYLEYQYSITNVQKYLRQQIKKLHKLKRIVKIKYQYSKSIYHNF